MRSCTSKIFGISAAGNPAAVVFYIDKPYIFINPPITAYKSTKGLTSEERGDFVKGKSNIVTDSKQERCVILGEYIAENSATVRSTAKIFGISKSTVHPDVTVRLAKVNPELYKKVKEVLQKNKDERHIRGGLATKRKYQGCAK